MSYSDKVLDHYENPRNVGSFDKTDQTVGTGMVGAPACGDVMKLQIKVGANGLIEDIAPPLTGFRAVFAEDIAVEMMLPKKTDEELAQELNAISPEILSQAKNPQMRKLVIDLYRKMLIEGVDIKNEKEVKKWLKKHPEAVNGGEAHKIETFKREEPKVGRNDACPCGSGRKYKKCCGKGK